MPPCIALAQTDLKRMLAYSTLSQIAIMLSALAAAPAELGPGAGISHLIGHAFFKALLFLGAGWLSVLAGATALAALRGRLRPTGALRWSMGIGLAALAGVPPLIGFFTKDTVIDAALEGATGGGGFRAWLVVVALFVTVVLTAAYCTRAWLLLDTPVAATGELPAAAPAVVAEEDVAVVTTADSADDAEVERVHAHGHAAITLPAALVVSVLAALTVVGTLLLTSLRGGVHVGAPQRPPVRPARRRRRVCRVVPQRPRPGRRRRPHPRPRPGAGGARVSASTRHTSASGGR